MTDEEFWQKMYELEKKRAFIALQTGLTTGYERYKDAFKDAMDILSDIAADKLTEIKTIKEITAKPKEFIAPSIPFFKTQEHCFDDKTFYKDPTSSQLGSRQPTAREDTKAWQCHCGSSISCRPGHCVNVPA